MSKIIFIFVFSTVLVSTLCESPIEEAFNANGIVPDVIDEAPKMDLIVNYKQLQVNYGNILTPAQVKEAPEVKFNGEPGAYYTLILTDPDAPSRRNPVRREWHHWLVVNIPGSKISQGRVLTEYAGSTPPKGGGLHRYVFLLYKQPGFVEFDDPYRNQTSKDRGNFSTEKFVIKYNLGKPYYGNFFQAEYTEV